MSRAEGPYSAESFYHGRASLRARVVSRDEDGRCYAALRDRDADFGGWLGGQGLRGEDAECWYYLDGDSSRGVGAEESCVSIFRRVGFCENKMMWMRVLGLETVLVQNNEAKRFEFSGHSE